MKKTLTHYSAQQKVAILRRHLLENVSVSDLYEQYQFHPTVFYRWQKEFFEHGAVFGCDNEVCAPKSEAQGPWAPPIQEMPLADIKSAHVVYRSVVDV